MKRRSKIYIALIVFAVIGTVAINYQGVKIFSYIYGVYWHYKNGNSVSFNCTEIKLTREWWVSKIENKALYLIRSPINLSNENIMLSIMKKDRADKFYKDLIYSDTAIIAKKKNAMKLSMNGEEAYMAEYHYEEDKDDHVTCFIKIPTKNTVLSIVNLSENYINDIINEIEGIIKWTPSCE